MSGVFFTVSIRTASTRAYLEPPTGGGDERGTTELTPKPPLRGSKQGLVRVKCPPPLLPSFGSMPGHGQGSRFTLAGSRHRKARERELIIRNSDQTCSQGISVGETEG